VRSVLAALSGKEIKHTGDGIMAAFASAANGVEAAVAIQRAVRAHTDDHPDLPIEIRIGMDAGEPIEEDDDLFGTTVQLASRACAAAHSGQIMCTNVVRELSAGKGQDFVSRGLHALKGFKEKIALFEVQWQVAPDSDTPDPADPPALSLAPPKR
jgi:class 3 adenylate cyclase